MKELEIRTESCKTAFDKVESQIAENKQLKEFEDYSYYAGGEITCNRMPKKYCAWVEERKALAAPPQKKKGKVNNDE